MTKQLKFSFFYFGHYSFFHTTTLCSKIHKFQKKQIIYK